MRLLNAEAAIIEPAKLQYLLDESQRENHGKSRVFYALGYTLEGWQRLEADIRDQLLVLDATPGRPSPHGETYEIVGTLRQMLVMVLCRNEFANEATDEHLLLPTNRGT